MTTKHAAEPRFTLQISEQQQKEIFMSFGLLNTLARFFEEHDQVEEELFTNSYVQSSVIVECLSERDEYGKIAQEFDLNTLTDLDSLDDFFVWVGAHLHAFFMRRLQAKMRHMKKTMETTP